MTTIQRLGSLILFVCLTLPVFAEEGEHQREKFLAAAEHFEKLGMLFRQSAELASPAVVNIKVTQTRSGRTRRGDPTRIPDEGSGSGIIATIAQKRVILTNRHVIEEAEGKALQIQTHDRTILTPTKIATNEDFDIAIIEFAEELPQSARLGDSDQVRVGDLVLAIGNPYGLDRSVSMGIISAVGRRKVPGASGSVPRIGFFQTDAAVNPGSSGGMLLNMKGEVVGILTAIATLGGGNEGVAFAMPINAVVRIAEQLVQTGSVVKPFVGFGFETTIPLEERRKLDIDRLVGARIGSVSPGTPAEQAGLKVGDVVLMFGDTEVEDDLHVTHLVAQSAIGKSVALQINRNGATLTITVTPIAQLSR